MVRVILADDRVGPALRHRIGGGAEAEGAGQNVVIKNIERRIGITEGESERDIFASIIAELVEWAKAEVEASGNQSGGSVSC